jgi:uncharacterized protein YbcI
MGGLAREAETRQTNVTEQRNRARLVDPGWGRCHHPGMTPSHDPAVAQSKHGAVLTAISDGMVSLQKEFYGRGPTRAKAYFQDDLVVVIMRGGFTPVEQTLLEGGRGDSVIQQRMHFQELMRERFTGVVEAATERKVIAFMSGNQQDPDFMSEVFVLAPTELIDELEQAHELPSRSHPRAE